MAGFNMEVDSKLPGPKSGLSAQTIQDGKARAPKMQGSSKEATSAAQKGKEKAQVRKGESTAPVARVPPPPPAKGDELGGTAHEHHHHKHYHHKHHHHKHKREGKKADGGHDDDDSSSSSGSSSGSSSSGSSSS